MPKSIFISVSRKFRCFLTFSSLLLFSSKSFPFFFFSFWINCLTFANRYDSTFLIFFFTDLYSCQFWKSCFLNRFYVFFCQLQYVSHSDQTSNTTLNLFNVDHFTWFYIGIRHCNILPYFITKAHLFVIHWWKNRRRKVKIQNSPA